MRKELFALAGAVMLTGCTQYVMQDRYYEDLPGTAPEGTAAMAPAEGAAVEFAPEVAEIAPAAPAEAPAAPAARPAFEPMEKVVSSPIISEGKKVSSGTAEAVKPGGTYVVKKNDTLGKIAKLHKVKLRDLMAVNNMK